MNLRLRNRQEMEQLWYTAHDQNAPQWYRDSSAQQIAEEYKTRKSWRTFYFGTIWGAAIFFWLFVIVMVAIFGAVAAIITIPIAIIFTMMPVLAMVINKKRIDNQIEEAYVMWHGVSASPPPR